RDIAAGETDADGHAFGKVVQRDRDHEQPKAAEPRSLRSLASLIEMLVRRMTMNHEERTRADEDADDDPRRSGADAKTLVAARVRERGLEQREEGRGEHHAGRTADQADEGSRRRLAQHEDRERADARAEPGEEARHCTEPENVGVSDRHMRASPLLSVRASATPRACIAGRGRKPAVPRAAGTRTIAFSRLCGIAMHLKSWHAIGLVAAVSFAATLHDVAPGTRSTFAAWSLAAGVAAVS